MSSPPSGDSGTRAGPNRRPVCRSPWPPKPELGTSARFAKPSEIVNPTLLLGLEGVILLTLSFDLADSFGWLPPFPRILLLLCAALGLAGTVWPKHRRSSLWNVPILALGFGSLVVGAVGLLEMRAAHLIRLRWDASAQERLESRARTIEGDFQDFLMELSRPLSRSGGPIGDRSSAFTALARAAESSRLPGDRLGFAIYRSDNSLLAWHGNNS